MLKFILTVFLISIVADAARSAGCDDKCSHSCLDGHCACPSNMVLAVDETTCQEKVLLAMFRGIKLLTTEKSKSDINIVIPKRVKAFDLDFAKGEIYAYSQNAILRYTLGGGLSAPSEGELVLSLDDLVTSLAVDWVHDTLYWISQEQRTVETASTRGEGHRIIANFSSESGSWRNIVVDPYAKQLFWLGHDGVHTSDLTGGHHSHFNCSLKAEKMALDIKNQLVYVIGDQGEEKVVFRTHYDGSQQKEVLRFSQPGKIYGFGVVGQVLYWQSSHDGENLYKAQLSGVKSDINLVYELLDIVQDMKLYHPDIQKKKEK